MLVYHLELLKHIYVERKLSISKPYYIPMNVWPNQRRRFPHDLNVNWNASSCRSVAVEVELERSRASLYSV